METKSRRFEFNSVNRLNYFVSRVTRLIDDDDLNWFLNWNNVSKKAKVTCQEGLTEVDLNTLDMFYAESDDI